MNKKMKPEYRKMVSALRRMRGRIESRRNSYLCFALSDVYTASGGSWGRAYHAIERAIWHGLMHPYRLNDPDAPTFAYYESWFEATNGFKPSEEQARQGRLDWLDALIAQAEREGRE